MRVYFVRHGITTLGERRLHQYPDTPLSQRGEKESRLLAQRFKSIDIGTIITSPFARAKKTAEIVNIFKKVPIEISDLFVETKRPREVEGVSYDDPEVKRIEEEIQQNWHKPQWRYSNEETYYELRERGNKALLFLEQHRADRMLVTTHGDIMKMMLSIMQHGPELKTDLFTSFRHFASTRHTGVTVCYYDTERGWYLVSWNDHAHLM